jgi:hypothetical protein
MSPLRATQPDTVRSPTTTARGSLNQHQAPPSKRTTGHSGAARAADGLRGVNPPTDRAGDPPRSKVSRHRQIAETMSRARPESDDGRAPSRSRGGGTEVGIEPSCPVERRPERASGGPLQDARASRAVHESAHACCGWRCRRQQLASRRLRKRVDLGLRPVGAPALHEVMPMHHVVVRWIAWRWAIGPGQERLSRAGRLSPTLHMGVARSRLSSPSPAHITEPVLRHTALGQCSRDGLHATVCRHRFLSVRSICLASWSTGPRWA